MVNVNGQWLVHSRLVKKSKKKRDREEERVPARTGETDRREEGGSGELESGGSEKSGEAAL